MADEKKKALVLGNGSNVITVSKEAEISGDCIDYIRKDPRSQSRATDSLPNFLDNQINWHLVTEVPQDADGKHLDGYLVYDPSPIWGK